MQPADALTEALTGTAAPPPPPVQASTAEVVVAVAGYAGPGAPAAARALNRIDPDQRLPPPGTTERKRYETDKRSWQRYLKWANGQPGQKRRPAAAVIERLRRRAITARNHRLIEKIRRRGARVRIHATVLDETPSPGLTPAARDRALPAGGPGWPLSAPVIRHVTDLFLDGHLDTAAAAFLDAFLNGYGFPEAELTDIERIKIWPNGDPEPP
jgi:hypothetical protein